MARQRPCTTSTTCMASLYEQGWRQGSILEATLPFDAVILGPTGHPERCQGEHSS